MRVYKPSGIKWLGEIPQGWEIKKLKYIGEIFGGVTGKTIKDFSKEYKLNFKPYITFTNVCNNAVINPDLMEYVFIDSKEKQNKVLKNDILFLQSSETFEDVGKSAIYLNNDEVYLNTFCKGFRIEREAYPMYLNYLLSSLSYKRYFMSVCSGFTRINLRQEHFLDIPLILPPLQEQKEIAEFLDSKCEKIQNYIEKKQMLITLLQEKKQALINEVVTKGLNPNIEFKNSEIEYLGLIPHHWEVVKVKYIATTNIGLVYDPSEIATNENVGYPVLRANNIQNGKIDYKDVIYVAKKIDDKQLAISGDLLMCVRNGSENLLGKTAKIENNNFSFGAFTAIIRSDLNNYLYWIFQTEMLKKSISSFIVSIGIGQISQDDIKNFKIPLPPLQEQKQIANFLDKKCEKINSAIEKTKRQIKLIKEYKNTLINEAVCGRVACSRDFSPTAQNDKKKN
ncbi:restriction endonuclease subunit S [Campylobacter upsaliensis]|uniref:restriction endonuclease subunit S n=1 Tax=Campylobacter upsaliensis TaxID=28080 RepID=UPI0012CC8138|nr:restriction endonuclease subunit S [Campylobacter upsaliensis]ECK6873231.1 restriction endonuclease subunit S [Campylobacter upsaliensis]ECV9711496.1 restriction endonuclease subunit S [Campylobacter upsaliensis]MBT0754631.1 restriction endonuclease subunit S [Campylobacter upsaliensis]